MSLINRNERPFQCTICNKSYKTSSMRAAHMDSHITGKTFEVSPGSTWASLLHFPRNKQKCYLYAYQFNAVYYVRKETTIANELPQPHEASQRREEAWMRVLRKTVLHQVPLEATPRENSQGPCGKWQQCQFGRTYRWRHNDCVRMKSRARERTRLYEENSTLNFFDLDQKPFWSNFIFLLFCTVNTRL